MDRIQEPEVQIKATSNGNNDVTDLRQSNRKKKTSQTPDKGNKSSNKEHSGEEVTKSQGKDGKGKDRTQTTNQQANPKGAQAQSNNSSKAHDKGAPDKQPKGHDDRVVTRKDLLNVFPIEFIQWSECEASLKREAKSYNPSDPMAFVKGNMVQYYLCSNLWCSLVADCTSDRIAYDFADNIRSYGLLAMIRDADKLATRYIIDLNEEKDDIGKISYCFSCIVSSTIDSKLVLQILRFPKRFTLCNAELLLGESLGKFWSIQDKWAWADTEPWKGPRKWDFGVTRYREPVFREYIARLQPYLDKMLGCVDFSSEADPYDLSFSSGSSQDGRTVKSKVHGIRKYQEYWLHPQYRIGDYKYRLGQDVPPYSVTPTAVPKSTKAYRIIAPEDAYHNAKFGAAYRYIYGEFKKKSCYSELINLDDQDSNREACRLGSLSGMLSTIDVTSASDSITIFHLDAYPDSFRRFILQNRASYGIKGKQRTTLLTALTSGNPMTFFTECCFYLACALHACDMVQPWFDEQLSQPFVYGDDIVIDTRAVGALQRIFEVLHITAQPEKSFSTGHYRESCGSEYYKGLDFQTEYWPRKVILQDAKFVTDDASSLIALQHRIQKYSWKGDRALRTLIRRFYPKMTSSLPGTECDDLWEQVPRIIEKAAPYDVKRQLENHEPRRLNECHYTTHTKYGSVANRDPAVEMYLYAEFLAHGPQKTGDPWLDMLGITLPTNRGAVYTSGVTQYNVTADI